MAANVLPVQKYFGRQKCVIYEKESDFSDDVLVAIRASSPDCNHKDKNTGWYSVHALSTIQPRFREYVAGATGVVDAALFLACSSYQI